MGESDGNRSGACANVNDARRLKARGEGESLLDQMLCFGPWNEHIRSNSEWKAIELGATGDVLNGLAVESALNQFQVMRSLLAGEFLFRMSHQPCYALSQKIEEQDLSVQPGSVGVRPHAETHTAL